MLGNVIGLQFARRKKKSAGPPAPVYFDVTTYGAVGNGVADDTEAIQDAIDAAYAASGGTVRATAGTYLVSSSAEYNPALVMKSGVDLFVDSGATIQMAANAYEETPVIGVIGVTGVKIYGEGTIAGDKSSHTGSTGEWGHGIMIAGSNNIEVSGGITVTNCWGDGIFIGDAYGGQDYSQNVLVDDFAITSCRRNGISVVSAKTATISNGTISGISGADPQCGIDIEPDTAAQFLQGIVIDNIDTSGCTHMGLLFALGNYVATTNDADITVTNFISNGDAERYNFYDVEFSETAHYVDYKYFLDKNAHIDISISDADYAPETPAEVDNMVPALTSTTNWDCDASSLSTAGGIISVTGNGTSQYINGYYNSSVACVTGHLVYVRVKVKVTNTICQSINVGIGGTSSYDYNTLETTKVSTPAQNQEYTLSGIYKLTEGSTGNICVIAGRHNYSSSANANGKVLQILEAGCCDLTAEFETDIPDTVWCDANLSFS